MKIESLSYPVKIGHRGFKKEFPENTMVGFVKALILGIQMVELDINLSKDHELMVIHDATLNRTSNGTGRVDDQTKTQLKKLDAGGWFDSAFSHEKIPTLEDVLKLTKNRMAVNIEVKLEVGETKKATMIIDRLIELLSKLNVMNQVIVSSFNHDFLTRLANDIHSPLIGVLSKSTNAIDVLSFCQYINAFSWHSDYPTLDAEQIELMHRNGLKVFTYTVNDQAETDRLKAMNVDGIISDDIELYI